jgi:integration host factor subunit beta
MKKSDLISVLAVKENLTELQATRIIKLIFDGFKEALVKNQRIEIRGFGNFVVRKYNSYAGRNPKTGEKVEVEPKKSAYFKVGKELKSKMNGAERNSS